MKKQLLIAATLMFATLCVKAQKPDTAGYMVHYKFSHMRDTTNRANPYTENMALFLGKNSSVYKSYDKQLQDALFKKELKEQIANSPDGNIKINRRNKGSGTQYYQFPAEKKLVRKDQILMNSYLITDALPVIDWKISSDTASFGGLHCQKATAHFKGRDYTAWFCPDMPFHAGPWKLNGLAGVILEAYDARKDVVFKFDGIEKVASPQPTAAASEPQAGDGHRMIMIGGDDSDSDPAIIEPPSRAIKTTEKEFSKLQEAMRKDPDAFVQAMMASSGMNRPGGGNGPRQDQIKIKVGPSPVNNNPIELPEKK